MQCQARVSIPFSGINIIEAWHFGVINEHGNYLLSDQESCYHCEEWNLFLKCHVIVHHNKREMGICFITSLRMKLNCWSCVFVYGCMWVSFGASVKHIKIYWQLVGEMHNSMKFHLCNSFRYEVYGIVCEHWGSWTVFKTPEKMAGILLIF